jgi:hypothetical protein
MIRQDDVRRWYGLLENSIEIIGRAAGTLRVVYTP